ncbi:hypothetical protein K7395_24835 [Streptomyces filamentosus]|uniref:Uncharacterized protein n=2 Tax=Streptomyces filamentosus TaxID=67294 RepID=A0ABY4V659_STRFL|nr:MULTISPECIES: hypothetical protein [Streptomyces]EFE74553.1 predicted protein [Streptomyces filamentosus NRRL 15998]EWS91653.1 hypothetical protein SSIG_02099 [Streptomyces filamentosus NRRL 11379]MYR78681.1 hypothetical protein [Streptomyces sp. SID5466]USC49716.1 hypothetical protein K7395_24835 [Streptomyces filamentosus]
MLDRIRGHRPSPSAPRDPEADAVLRQILATPSLAAQMLTAAADHLDKHKPTDELSVAGWARAFALADARVLTGYPQAVAQHAGRRAMRALRSDMWDSARTRGEWALCLRDIARSV